MDNIPPSYEVAVARNPWALIAPYIPSAELCALNRVNHGLHHVFAPCLWGNPASHFGTENDRVYGEDQNQTMECPLLTCSSCLDTFQKNPEASSPERARAYPYSTPPSRSIRGKITTTNLSGRARPLTSLKAL